MRLQCHLIAWRVPKNWYVASGLSTVVSSDDLHSACIGFFEARRSALASLKRRLLCIQ